MSSSRKQHGSIHKIREFELEKVNLSDEFDILQIVGEGWFGKILLVEHHSTHNDMVLKALPKPYVSLRDFYREFHYGLHLGAHKNIVTTFDVAFETAGFYVFTQEYAPLGDLTSNVSDVGIGEIPTKRVAKQIASALDYIHSKDLVHRDVKLDNVLVYRSDFSRVKLCDFGETRKAYTYVQRRNEWLPYSPPEVLAIHTDQTYQTVPSHDLWQFGIVLFVCLTGSLPWQKAASDDPRYMRYFVWQNSTMVIPIKRTPKLFKLLTSRACKLFRKFLEPIPERRPKNSSDLHKFLDDRWLAKNAEKDMIANEPDELCASMYSFHSSPEEKNKLLFVLTQHGIETTVDRVEKKKRICDWIQESVIAEEEEEEDEEDVEDDGKELQTRTARAPVAGHVSSVRAAERTSRTQIVSTVKDASNKHINPRTGKIQHGPSEMGHHEDTAETHPATHNHKHRDATNGNGYRPENNGHAQHHNSSNGGRGNGGMAHRRLIDVGSQTSYELQAPADGSAVNDVNNSANWQNSQTQSYGMTNSNSVPTVSHVAHGTNAKTKTTHTKKLEPTSRGYLSAFNSLATIAVPEIQKYKQPVAGTAPSHKPRNSSGVDRSQSIKHSSPQQRYDKAAALVKQPMSRSIHNFNNLVNDSGYGSFEKLRPIDSSILSSPIFTKRHDAQSNLPIPPTNEAGGSSNERIHINGILHTQNENGSPFHSDAGSDESPRGSNGFVNLAGTKRSSTPTSNEKPSNNVNATAPAAQNHFRMTMKGTAYDQIQSNRKKKWNDP